MKNDPQENYCSLDILESLDIYSMPIEDIQLAITKIKKCLGDETQDEGTLQEYLEQLEQELEMR